MTETMAVAVGGCVQRGLSIPVGTPEHVRAYMRAQRVVRLRRYSFDGRCVNIADVACPPELTPEELVCLAIDCIEERAWVLALARAAWGAEHPAMAGRRYPDLATAAARWHDHLSRSLAGGGA